MFGKGRKLGGLVAAMIAVGLAGCQKDDGNSDTPTRGDGETPHLNIIAETGCSNYLPVATRDQLTSGTMPVALVTVTGTDPDRSNREIENGTAAVIFVSKQADARHPNDQGQPGGSGGRFVSDPLGTGAQSKDVTFTGGEAVDRFYCAAAGTVTLHAALGTIKNNKIQSAEYPAGSGEKPLIRTATDQGFAIRCVSADDFRSLCSGVGADAAPPDLGVAADAGGDGGPDGDVGPDMAPPPPRWSIAYDSPMANDLTIGIRGSFRQGQSDNIELRFRVTKDGHPPPQPVTVDFSLGGQASDANLSARNGHSDVTDADGLVRVTLLAGTRPGVVSVDATAHFPENVMSEPVHSPPITIRGGIPSKRGFGFQCDDPVISAFGERSGNSSDEWHLSLDDGTNCHAVLADRLGGFVDQATQVFFLSEAGNVTQAAATDAMGVATTHLRVGPPVPLNVPPMQYEQDDHLVVGADDEATNPRDGLVRLIAVTRGEENFQDTDGNAFYEEGVDIFDGDLPEPFIDANDNGTYDPDEAFRDLNGNGGWDPSNGVWDNNTEIWEDTEVLWTGDLALGPNRQLSYFKIDTCDANSNCDLMGGIPGCPGGLDFYLRDLGHATVAMRFVDSNGNCLDGYNSGTVSLTTNGSISVFPGAAQNFTINDCFRDGCGGEGCPEPAIYTAEIRDPNQTASGMAAGSPPTLVDVTATVTYRGVGNSQNHVSFTLQGCVQ